MVDDYTEPHVYRYLLPHESNVVTVRFHPAVVIKPVAAAVAGLLGAGLLASLKISPDDKLSIWVAWFLLLLYMIKRIMDWYSGRYVVTMSRMLVIKGILTKDVEMLPIASASTLTLRRTFGGIMLGYGKFVMAGTGQDPALRVINYLAYPEQLYLEVCALAFPENAASST
jgi:hypothetical protein